MNAQATVGTRASARAPPAVPWSQTVIQRTQLALILEVSTPKPGNVSPLSDDGRSAFPHFVASALSLGPSLQRAIDPRQPLGDVMFQGVRDSLHAQGGGNVHLGSILLCYPIARVAATLGPTLASSEPGVPLPVGELRGMRTLLRQLIGSLTLQDTLAVFDAIQASSPGGLRPLPQSRFDAADPDTRGRLEEADLSLQQWMATGLHLNAIAAEYCSGFELTLTVGLPALWRLWPLGLRLATTRCYLELLAARADSLVAGKGGEAAAATVQRKAAELLEGSSLADPVPAEALDGLDRWLRQEHLNPGTTADLTAAALQVGLLRGLTMPRGWH